MDLIPDPELATVVLDDDGEVIGWTEPPRGPVVDPPAPERRVLDALRSAGVITFRQAEDARRSLG